MFHFESACVPACLTWNVLKPVRPSYVLLAAIAIVFLASAAAAQVKPITQSPDQKPRKVKSEPTKVFKEWVKEVDPILTQAEREAFAKLRTDAEREQFIDDFWRRRDPDPDTQENEFKDEYYERMAYANEHFTSGKPGWLTDRGKIYLKFGRPNEVESHPAGGQYQKAYWEGEGSAATYPWERWFYRYLPNVGSGVEMEFVDPSGSGEYRLARNPFEKMVAGFGNGPTPDQTMGWGVPDCKRQQDCPFEVIRLQTQLQAPLPDTSAGVGRLTVANSPVAEDNVLGLEIKPHYFLQSDGRVMVAFAIQTDNRDLVFKDSGGLQVARLNIKGTIVTPTLRKLGSFEESVETTATTAEIASAKERKSVYAKAVLLTPGKYRLDLLVRDVANGSAGFQQFGFTVPRFEENKLAVSSLVLATRVESQRDLAGLTPFTIGLIKVVPNVSATYHRGASVGVYLQVYNAGIDQLTLQPAVDIEYVLLKGDRELKKQTEDWNGNSDLGTRLTLARLMETRDLQPGTYEVQIRIHDHVTGQTLAPSAKFIIAN